MNDDISGLINSCHQNHIKFKINVILQFNFVVIEFNDYLIWFCLELCNCETPIDVYLVIGRRKGLSLRCGVKKKTMFNNSMY